MVYACVRRWFTPGAALLAGAVVALTPVATLMFRFNNPDALLTLLLTGAAYATIRAVEAGRTRWLVLAGTLVGFGFITKMLQAVILMPVLGLVYLVAGPPKLGRRIVQLVWTGRRPRGVGRLVGGRRRADPGTGPPLHRRLDRQQPPQPHLRLQRHRPPQRERDRAASAAEATAGSMWGPTGWDRLFTKSFGGQISWLIPGALIGLVAVLWLTRRAPRTDRTRAAFLLFGGWLLLTGLILSFAQGIIHPYYTVVLAPAVGALVGMGGTVPVAPTGGAGSPGSPWLRPCWPPSAGRSCSSAGARRGIRRCGGPSWPPASWPRVGIALSPGPAASWPPASPASASPPSSPGRPPTPSTPRRPRTPGPSPRPGRPSRAADSARAAAAEVPDSPAARPGGPGGFAGGVPGRSRPAEPPAVHRAGGFPGVDSPEVAPARAPGPAPAPGRSPCPTAGPSPCPG